MLAETVAPLLVDTLKKLLVTLVSSKAGKVMGDFWKRRKIEGVVERCAVDTAESLAPYFEHERISEEAQRLIVECCGRMLRPLAEEPQKLLRGSLDADKVNVSFTPSGKAAQLLTYDETCAGEGWRYDDKANPKQVVLCPTTCTAAKADPAAKLSLEFGCLTRGAKVR